MTDQALGLIETRGLIAAIEAADAGLKAADVKLLARYKADAALVTIEFLGEVAAVRAAVDAGSAAATKIGTVVSTHVIPRPATELFAELVRPDKRNLVVYSSSPDVSTLTPDYLESLSVSELRNLARQFDSFGIKGRDISKANKEQLISEFKKLS